MRYSRNYESSDNCNFFLTTITSLTIASNVVKLDDSNFDTYIRKTSVAFVTFTVTWCGYCFRMKPSFEQAAEILKIEDSTKIVINVDCEKGVKTCRKFKVPAYPTMILFINGAVDQKYTGDHTSEAIVSFMRSQHPPSSINLLPYVVIWLSCIVCAVIVFRYFVVKMVRRSMMKIGTIEPLENV